MKGFELDAIDLALYIKKQYYSYENNIDKREISPIKLQKSLYFLFAYWGQYIRRAELNPDNVEVDLSKIYNENLYAMRIEAWTYGPVLPDIYRMNNNGDLDIQNLKDDFLSNKYELKEFIDNLLKDLFEADDFGLVKLSHEDDVWIRNYIESDIVHDREMPKKDIIEEYAKF